MMIENGKLKTLFRFSVWIAVVFAICFYNNTAGIACAVFGCFMAGFFWWLIAKKRGDKIGFWHMAYGVSCILLGMIPAITDNAFVLNVGRLLFCVILIKWSLHIYYRVERIDFIRNISMIFDFFFTAVSQVFAPLTDVRWINEKNKVFPDMPDTNEPEKPGCKKQILLGIAISIPVLIVVLFLLSSADVVFRNLVVGMFNGIDNIVFLLKWLITAVVGFVIAYGCGRGLLQNTIRISDVPYKKADSVIGITFTAIISAVYVLFCGVQIVALLNTNGNLLPGEYTYAQYARTGFFQLLLVCLINVCMVIVCRLKFNMNGILKKLLTVISVCTYLMVASSVYRMILYIQNYNLSFLRILVLWALAGIAVVMVFVIWFIYDENIKLFEYLLMSVTVLFILFAFSRPDNLIAEYNIAHFDEKTKDVCYLTSHLSMDAAKTVISELETEESTSKKNTLQLYCKRIVKEYEEEYKGDIRKFNYSRYQAYQSAKEYLEE